MLETNTFRNSGAMHNIFWLPGGLNMISNSKLIGAIMLFYHTLWSYFECVTSSTALSGRPGKRKLQDLLNLEAATLARKTFGNLYPILHTNPLNSALITRLYHTSCPPSLSDHSLDGETGTGVTDNFRLH